MRIYFDPSVLVPLCVEELASVGIRDFVLRHSPQVLLNELQELELKNAIRQKGDPEGNHGSRCGAEPAPAGR